MSGSSQIICEVLPEIHTSEVLPEIHTTENCIFFKPMIHSQII